MLTVLLAVLPACGTHAEDPPPDSPALPPPVEVAASTRTLEPSRILGAGAASDDPESAALAAAIREALLNSPSLRADYARFQAARLRVPQVTELPDPMISYTQFVESVQTRTGEQEYVLGVSQTVPWFGKLALRGRIAEREAYEALESYRAAMLDVVHAVSTAWARLIYETTAFGIARQEREYLSQFLGAAASVYESGASGRLAVVRAQTELARVENDLARYPARIEGLKAELNREMGRPADADLPAPVESALPLLAPSRDALLDAALDRRPEIARIDHRIGRFQAERQLARKAYWPDITLGAGYIGIGDRPDRPLPRPRGEGDDAWNVSIRFDIPLPRAGRRARVEEAERMEEQARFEKARLEYGIRAAIHGLTENLEALETQLLNFETSLIPLAREGYETSRSEYLAAIGSYLDFLEAERAYLRTLTSYAGTVRDYRIALADLERAIGAPLRPVRAETAGDER